MSLVSLIGQGFLLGLALSPTCLGICVPVLLPYLSSESRTWKTNQKIFIQFLLGRLLGYLSVGVLVGWISGSHKLVLKQHSLWEAALWIGLGIILVLFSGIKSMTSHHVCQRISQWPALERLPILLGALTGLNPCPPFLAVIARAAFTEGPLGGAVVFFAFFVGTSLILLPLPALGILGRWKAVQLLGRGIGIGIGLFFIVQGLWIGVASH